MAQHAISAVHYQDKGGTIDLVAIHPVVDKEFGSTELTLGAVRRISVEDCIKLIASGEEVCLVRRTEDHKWEITCDVELGPSGKEITGVDLVDRPNDALQELPRWE
jgi:hypothetical protein